jgi:hypothetical protein
MGQMITDLLNLSRFSRKPLTDEERDARRRADRERIEQAARALLTSDGWQRWMRVRATNGLSRYSLLISGGGCRHRADNVVSVDDMSLTRINAVYRFECVSGSEMVVVPSFSFRPTRASVHTRFRDRTVIWRPLL